MNLLRALARHLDPWAGLLLGLLVAMAVIILLVTPGPWNRVVGKAPAAAPTAQPTTDVAVFVTSGGPPVHCTAAFWLHTDPSASSVTVVLVPAQANGFLAGGGYEPLGEIVDDAGPAAGAAALGDMVGVPMRLWVDGGLKAVRDAFPLSFPDVWAPATALRMQDAVRSWSDQGAPAGRFARQYSFMQLSLAESDYPGINVIAFANYVLAAPGMSSNLDLQTAASVAATLRRLGSSTPAFCALPAISEVTRHSASWHLESGPAFGVRQSLALGVSPPAYAARVTTRRVPATVVAVLDPLGSVQQPYLAALARRLRDSSGGPVHLVALVVGHGDDAAARLARVLDRTRPQAVLIGLGWRTTKSDAALLATRLTAVTAMLRERDQAAVLTAAPAGGDGAIANVIGAAAKSAGLPLSPAPVSPPAASSAPAARARVQQMAGTWAAAHAATLVRACDPALFAPRLAGSKAGVSYYKRSKATVLLSGAGIPARYAGWLATCGWQTTAHATPGWSPLSAGAIVSYRPGSVLLARALAGDLGLPAASIVADARAPATLVVTVM